MLFKIKEWKTCKKGLPFFQKILLNKDIIKRDLSVL